MELCRGVGNTFQAVSSRGTGEIRPRTQHIQPSNLTNDILQLRKKLKKARRENQELVHKNDQQRALIAKFRCIAQGIINATTPANVYL